MLLINTKLVGLLTAKQKNKMIVEKPSWPFTALTLSHIYLHLKGEAVTTDCMITLTEDLNVIKMYNMLKAKRNHKVEQSRFLHPISSLFLTTVMKVRIDSNII